MRAWRTVTRSTRYADPQKRGFHCSHAPQKEASIAELLRSNSADHSIEVNGWIRSVRKQKKVAFVALGDGSSIDPLQAVLKPEQVEQ